MAPSLYQLFTITTQGNCMYCCWNLRRVLRTCMNPSNFSAAYNVDESRGTSLPLTVHEKCAPQELLF